MATALLTSLHTETDVCFAKTPGGELFMVNGIDRGRKWNGAPASSPVVIGLDAPSSAPTVTAASTGGAEAGDYVMYYRFGDADGNYSNLSPVAELTMTAGQKFSWDTIPIASGTDSSARITKRQLFRSLVNSFEIVYLVAEIADNTTTSYSGDTLTDDDLADNEELPLFNSDDSENANRFGLPPTTKSVVIWNQNRMFYLVDAIYSSGTITVTNASTSLTGTGTSFNKEMVGRYVYPAGSSKGYRISAYVSATALTLAENAVGTLSNVAYEIRPAPGELNALFWSESDEPESVPQAQNKFILQQNVEEEDALVGGYTIGPTLYVCGRRHTYAFNYTRQPHLDGRASLLFRRGLFNHNCSDIGDGVVFAMDEFGPYMVAGGGIQDIGERIADKFRDATIDFSYRRRFHVRVNRRTSTAYFFVALAGDSGVKSAFAYNYKLDRWTLHTYPWLVGAAANLQVGNNYDFFVGMEDDRFVKETWSAGSDGVASVSGVVSSAGGAVVSTTSIFTSDMVLAPLVFTSGALKGSRYKITARNSATNVTVDPAVVGAVAGDTFVVGGIPWSMKTGPMTFPQQGIQDAKREIAVVYKPTDNANSIDVQYYLNHNTTPETGWIDRAEEGDNAATALDSADNTIDTYKDKSEFSPATGYGVVEISGKTAGRVAGKRFVSTKLRGVAAAEPVEVSDLFVTGAK